MTLEIWQLRQMRAGPVRMHVTPVMLVSVACLHAGDVTSTQMAMGFERVKDGLTDYELDCPSARTIYEDIAARGRDQKWL